MACLRLSPGQVVVDATLGGGGHTRAILARIAPGGQVVGLDVDALELSRTEACLRAEGFGREVFVARQSNFADLRQALSAERVDRADAILVDLGVSAMQYDDPRRGFSYKGVGPLDMRMNPTAGPTAAVLVASAPEAELARILVEHADEPHAGLIARLLKSDVCDTTHATERRIRMGLQRALPHSGKSTIKMSVRRTFQALRIAVNDEFGALERLLHEAPACLAPGGRIAVLTFHSGEDRRVKKAFLQGRRAGLYDAVAERVIRSQKAETFSNRRASSAKLRWAQRATAAHTAVPNSTL